MTHKKLQEKSNSSQGTQKKTNKWYFRMKFNFQKAFPSTFSEENGHAEVGEKNSNNTFVLCTCSPFSIGGSCWYKKKTIFNDALCYEKQKSQV